MSSLPVPLSSPPLEKSRTAVALHVCCVSGRVYTPENRRQSNHAIDWKSDSRSEKYLGRYPQSEKVVVMRRMGLTSLQAGGHRQEAAQHKPPLVLIQDPSN